MAKARDEGGARLGAAASFRYPRSSARPTSVEPNDEEITAVHEDLEPSTRPVASLDGEGAPVEVGPEGTLRLGPGLGPGAREETALLAADELEPPLGSDDDEPTTHTLGRRLHSVASRQARAVREETTLLEPAELDEPTDDRGTVVLPGGGHPTHLDDRTELIDLGGSDEPDEPSAAISLTSVLSVSVGAPEAIEVVRTASLSGPGDGAVAPVAWTMPRAAPAPTGGYPVVSGPYPVVSGAYPVVSGAYPVVTTSGARPVVRRPIPHAKARRGGAGAAPTGAHPTAYRPRDETTRLAWGFLVGVLIVVATVGGAVALAMFLWG